MKTIKNIVGQKFGRLTVLNYDIKKGKRHYWICICECGTKKSIASQNFKYGNTSSCGCIKTEYEDIIGQKFGKLTVVELQRFIISGKHQIRKWSCLCECGGSKYAREDYLKYGFTKTCGCHDHKQDNRKNLTGMIFGRLKVMARKEKSESRHTYRWLCRCECGKQTIVDATHLVTGTTRSCGCYRLEKITKHGLSQKRGYRTFLRNNNPEIKLRDNVSNLIRSTIKSNEGTKGGRIFDYLPYTPQQLKKHLESLWEFWMSWENYGGQLGDVRKTWWIDHIIPQCHFNYKSLDDKKFQECWALLNLRPLEKMENAKKHTSLI